MIRRPPISTRTDTLFPYTTLFRSVLVGVLSQLSAETGRWALRTPRPDQPGARRVAARPRSGQYAIRFGRKSEIAGKAISSPRVTQYIMMTGVPPANALPRVRGTRPDLRTT